MEKTLVYNLYLPLIAKIVIWLACVVFGSAALIIFVGSFFLNWTDPPWFIALVFLGIAGGNAFWIFSTPHKILLHDDETIEFISTLKSRRIPVREIVSIKPQGTSFGFLAVRTGKRKIRIVAQFDGFHDLLTRIAKINPGVELRGC